MLTLIYEDAAATIYERVTADGVVVETIPKNPDPLRGEEWLVNVLGRSIDAFPTKKAAQAAAESLTGQALVNHMDAIGARAGADFMRQVGIPGIRYLDGGSRGAGAGTSNYVIFPGNENLLRILERNGVPIGN